MIALMYDGLELGTFYKDDGGILRLRLNKGVKKSWLPYIFEIGIDCNMEKIIKSWIKERVFPKNRIGAKEMLKELGLKSYNIDKIAELTRCSILTDPYWMVYDENDKYSTHSVRGQIGMDKYPYNSLMITNEEDYKWRI